MSGYIGNIPVPQATQTRDVFTATSGQTTFATSGYTPGFLDVWLNGVKLVNGTDFTATNGSDVVLASGAATSDIVEVLSYSTYEVNNQAFTGDFSVDGTTLKVDSTNDLVGIGNGSPISYYNGARNLVVGGTSGNNGMTVVSGPTGVGRLFFADGTSGADAYRGYVEYSHNSNNLIFGTDGTTRMVIDAGGRVTTPDQPKFSVNGNTSQWLTLGAGNIWYVITDAVGVNNSTAIIGANLSTNNYGSVAGSGFNASTGKFTAPVAGMYIFTLSLYLNKLTSGREYVHINSLYNSGVQGDYTIFGDLGGGPGYMHGVKLTWLIYMQANDTWAPAIFSGSANAFQIYGDYVRISGYLVG